MKNQKFKIGDRVLAKDNVNWYKTPAPGTIVDLYRREPVDGKYDYLVKFDSGSTLWSNVTGLIQKPPVIVITTDGKTTTAAMRQGKTILKQATARCSDKDIFDFSEGARIAFERLQGSDPFQHGMEKPTYYNGKIVCISTPFGTNFTVGKVYNVKEGRIKLDSGHVTAIQYESLNHINLCFESKFAALVED